jgi:transcriptional regulator
MAETVDILPGTLDLLILKAASLGGLHGYGILLRIQQLSAGALLVEQGALYPALSRLELRGMLRSEWGVSENNRRAKYYALTKRGEDRLREQVASWNRLTAAVATVLEARPREA